MTRKRSRLGTRWALFGLRVQDRLQRLRERDAGGPEQVDDAPADQAAPVAAKAPARRTRAGELVARARAWLDRGSAAVNARINGWSTRKRWAVLVLVPVLAVGCCGAPAVIVGGWFVRTTIEAGKGAASPDAAADLYLGLLSHDQEDNGLFALLDDDRRDDLLGQWRAYRDAMQATDPAPFRLTWSGLDVGPVVGGRASVRVDVEANWWEHDSNNRSIMYDSEHLPWVIDVREDDGWRVERVTPPPWCGPGGYVVRCAGDPAPVETPAPSISALSPLDEAREDLEEMLPCGPRDPFRDMPGRNRSCPPLTRATAAAPTSGTPAASITPLPSGS